MCILPSNPLERNTLQDFLFSTHIILISSYWDKLIHKKWRKTYIVASNRHHATVSKSVYYITTFWHGLRSVIGTQDYHIPFPIPPHPRLSPGVFLGILPEGFFTDNPFLSTIMLSNLVANATSPQLVLLSSAGILLVHGIYKISTFIYYEVTSPVRDIPGPSNPSLIYGNFKLLSESVCWNLALFGSHSHWTISSE